MTAWLAYVAARFQRAMVAGPGGSRSLGTLETCHHSRIIVDYEQQGTAIPFFSVDFIANNDKS